MKKQVCIVFIIVLASSLFSLRSYAKILTTDDVRSMLRNRGFFAKEYSVNKSYCNPNGNFSNDYVSRTLNGDRVVVDRATGLMWHQSGSSSTMYYKKAIKWIDKLNRAGYAGYSDWRLPTLEEGASLIESSKSSNGKYVDAVFSAIQEWIWTSDQAHSADAARRAGYRGAWYVDFYGGCVRNYRLIYFGFYVRPVRSGK